MPNSLPHIERLSNGAHQFIVDGKPFLMRPGELQNSSMSSAEHMEEVWPAMVELGLNTVLGAVTWQQIEPKEGLCDFKQLDTVIAGAREHGLKLILVWFGSFKNGTRVSLAHVETQLIRAFNSARRNILIYPKLGQERSLPLPRAMIDTSSPKPVEVLSVFHPSCARADAEAFAALLAHVKEVDGQDGVYTVIMAQVENEVGLLGECRDRSREAEKRFGEAVPKDLVDVLRRENKAGKLNEFLKANLGDLHSAREGSSWTKVFGDTDQTGEIFMAYHYALYVEEVAAAGKAVHGIPLFTNAWMRMTQSDIAFACAVGNAEVPKASGGQKPGDYPCGGPIETVLDIWQLFAPTLDFLAPDIYNRDYERTCLEWQHRGQPLFIPEQRRDEYGAMRTWTAIANYGAIGASPFAVDTLPDGNPLGIHFKLLRDVSAKILEARREGWPMQAFYFDRYKKGENDPSPAKKVIRLGEWELTVQRVAVPGQPGPAFGLLILTAADTLLCVGEGYQISVGSTRPGISIAGTLSVEEKVATNVETGEMRTRRIFNGDETQSGTWIVMPSSDPDYGDTWIPMFIQARTRVAEAQLYAY